MKILITGGNSDIAKYLEKNLAKEKYIIDMPSRQELDVSISSNVSTYFEDNYYDLVINCAGTLYSSSIVNSDPLKWINDINVNLIGTYLVCREALLNNKNCKIINISSTAAFNSYSDWSSYCASKAGVLKISQALSKDGFNIITLCPGAINTKIRNNLSIKNDNIMTIEEGCLPIIMAIENKYSSGDIIFYRKNEFKILNEY
ncbi:SDR family NAD(P)-dependent oxidoreductase [Providencia huaxiensis]|uniref:SDR family oxidoreductase n=1 Tax=Providencia TaxID=586 RepID=UPI002555E554|nr:SDR family oxidoreductase [Providencia rettgeri]